MYPLLFDQNLSHKLVDLLEDLFPDSLHVRMVLMQRSDDLPIYQYAKDHNYTIVTKDKDYSNIVTLRGAPPKVIWLQCGNAPTPYVELLLRNNYGQIMQFLEFPYKDVMELR